MRVRTPLPVVVAILSDGLVQTGCFAGQGTGIRREAG
jgi:hypothetical protein